MIIEDESFFVVVNKGTGCVRHITVKTYIERLER